MTLGTRAVLHTARKWKKTLLLFCLLLFITTLVLSGLAIADAQEEQAEELRGVTGASFTVERNLSTGGWTSGTHGSYSTQEFISEEMLQEIASVDGIAGYDASIVSMPTLFREAKGTQSTSCPVHSFCSWNSEQQGKEKLITNGKVHDFYTYGSINTEYNDLFVSGRFELVEGSHKMCIRDRACGVRVPEMIVRNLEGQTNVPEIGNYPVGKIMMKYNEIMVR